jgi:hypothetical protein
VTGVAHGRDVGADITLETALDLARLAVGVRDIVRGDWARKGRDNDAPEDCL